MNKQNIMNKIQRQYTMNRTSEIKDILNRILILLVAFSVVGMVLGFSIIIYSIYISTDFMVVNDQLTMDLFGYGLIKFVAFGWIAFTSLVIQLKIKGGF
tara:strand:- start:45 stop:341 length:297 start_codon:yes stop_codon:yes gene_type:complete